MVGICGYSDSAWKLLTLPFPSSLDTNHFCRLLNIFCIMQIVPTLCHAFACDDIPILITFQFYYNNHMLWNWLNKLKHAQTVNSHTLIDYNG